MYGSQITISGSLKWYGIVELSKEQRRWYGTTFLGSHHNVENFHERLLECLNKAIEHFQHFTRQTFRTTSAVVHLIFKHFLACALSNSLLFMYRCWNNNGQHIRWKLQTHWQERKPRIETLHIIIQYVPDSALLQWISEYAVRAYTTADSAASYSGASIPMGQGGHVPPNIWTGGTWSRMSPPQ